MELVLAVEGRRTTDRPFLVASHKRSRDVERDRCAFPCVFFAPKAREIKRAEESSGGGLRVARGEPHLALAEEEKYAPRLQIGPRSFSSLSFVAQETRSARNSPRERPGLSNGSIITLSLRVVRFSGTFLRFADRNTLRNVAAGQRSEKMTLRGLDGEFAASRRVDFVERPRDRKNRIASNDRDVGGLSGILRSSNAQHACVDPTMQPSRLFNAKPDAITARPCFPHRPPLLYRVGGKKRDAKLHGL